MELHQQRSCGQSLEGSTLGDIPLDTSHQRAVLRERSANWPHDLNPQSIPKQKRSRTSSPIENNYARRPAHVGSYLTGHVHAQHIGLAGFGAEKSEKQVEYELKRLDLMLQRSDKYQKYREKQPNLTRTEVLAKEARELAEQQAKEAERVARGEPKKKPGRDEKDKTVWPEFLEHAFWRALVRWPPMGRKKHMLDGALRGRNELIQDSIRRDTGIIRDRKQVSSHLQVLKQHLANLPGVLVYMAAPEDDKKRHGVRESSHAYQVTRLRDRHHAQRIASVARYDYNDANTHARSSAAFPPLSFDPTASRFNDGFASAYSVANFAMLASVKEDVVHCFTRLPSEGRLDDVNVTDAGSWRRQFPEFRFLQAQMEQWALERRRILVCDASMKVMTEVPPNTHLFIEFNLDTQHDLSVFDSIQCTTRFYDSGDSAPDPQLDGCTAHDLKEHRKSCKFEPSRHGSHGSSGCLTIAFGSKFWVNRMTKYQSMRHRDEKSVAESLLRLTATQDIYGIKPETGEAECILTILWRFSQSPSSAEVGSMNWRAVNVDTRVSSNLDQKYLDQKWYKEAKGTPDLVREDVIGGRDGVLDYSEAASLESSAYHHIAHQDFDFGHQHPSPSVYDIHSTQEQPQPQLQLDILASMQPDLEHPHASAAPSASTDFSQHSLPELSHGRDPVDVYTQNANDFDFHGGHITISGAFEPTINLSAYDNFASQTTDLSGLHALSGLDQDGYSLGLACADSNELVDVGVGNHLRDGDLACYSTKPNWHRTNLIPSLEDAAEQYHTYMGLARTANGHDGLQTQHILEGPSPALGQSEELVARGLHDAQININPGLWNLQSPFHEDTAGGASDGSGCRKDSGVHGHGVGLGVGVLELIERDQRTRGYQTPSLQ
ncbi:TEA/ATTS domain family-domain-containing protein [Paraphoma chrysanthemicola]|nr:TEA/ATTS domain family-domain-containing protein [Paraphoma chrysanthemicola]